MRKEHEKSRQKESVGSTEGAGKRALNAAAAAMNTRRMYKIYKKNNKTRRKYKTCGQRQNEACRNSERDDRQEALGNDLSSTSQQGRWQQWALQLTTGPTVRAGRQLGEKGEEKMQLGLQENGREEKREREREITYILSSLRDCD